MALVSLRDVSEGPNQIPRLDAPVIRDSSGTRVGEFVRGPLQLPIVGGRVEQCRLDNAFGLAFDVADRWWNLRLEGPFALSSADLQFEFSDDAPPSHWGIAVDATLHATVVDADVSSDGVLTLLFSNSVRLEARPSERWEAWQLSGPDDELVVCGPEGQLSRWPRLEESPT